jgi:metallo-beta-lactamase class B
MKARFLLAAALLAVTAAGAGYAQQRVQLPITNKDWEKPFPGFKIVGNFYYVGTHDLAAYLIATNDGLILINSGAPGSYPLMKTSIEQLGFRLADIKIITSTHGHWDHVGDLAEFQKVSKARVLMSERDAPVLESGGNLDYRRPEGRGIIYDPIKVDQRLKDGDKFRLGTTEVTVINTPGHTPGATSFSFPVQDGGRTYNVLIANMPGINNGVKLLGSPGYPTIVQDFAGTIARLKGMSPDIWVSSHAPQFNLHTVYKPGDAYNPARFSDLAAFKAKLTGYEKSYNEQLAMERAEQKK